MILQEGWLVRMVGHVRQQHGFIGSILKMQEQLPYGAPAGICCPGKHALRVFDTPRAGFGCDVCGKELAVGATMTGCRECNWDCCEECSGPECNDAGAAVHLGRDASCSHLFYCGPSPSPHMKFD